MTTRRTHGTWPTGLQGRVTTPLVILCLSLTCSLTVGQSQLPVLNAEYALSLRRIITSRESPQGLLRQAEGALQLVHDVEGEGTTSRTYSTASWQGDSGDDAREISGPFKTLWATRVDPEQSRTLSLRSLLESGRSQALLLPSDAEKLSMQLPIERGKLLAGYQNVAKPNIDTAEGVRSEFASNKISRQASFLHGGIPGSRIHSADSARKLRERWDCLLSLGAAQWELNPAPRLLPWPREEATHPLCAMKKGYLGPSSNEDVANGLVTPGTWGVAESLKYVWRLKQPGVCPGTSKAAPDFTHLDADGFCSSLRGRGGSLFLVGDSLTGHFWVSLRAQLEMLGVHVEPLDPTPTCAAHLEFLRSARLNPMSGKWPACSRHMICAPSREQGGVELHFILSERLWRVNQTSRNPQWALPWGSEMQLSNASVVILNRGAHISGTRLYGKEIKRAMVALRNMLPEVLVVFRSTAEGHPNCQEHEHPIPTPLRPLSWPFHWEAFAEQNAIARAAVEEIGGVYLDVNPMTSLRPDWHIGGRRNDCLHYCEPGPVDAWVASFGHMLQELV